MKGIMAEKPPAALFKYRPMLSEADLKYTREIIVDHKLYFPSPLQFNDPFDAVPAIEIGSMPRAERRRRLKEMVTRNKDQLNGIPRDVTERMLRTTPVKQLEVNGRNALREMLGEIGLCSMSARDDHVLMWAHYASAHAGICIGFRPLPYDVRSAVCRAYPVTYSEVRPKHNPLELMSPGGAFGLMLHKADFWRYEEEWRLVRLDPTSGPGHESFDRRRLFSITFGVKTTPETIRLVLGWIKERGRDVELYQAVPDDNDYRIRIEPFLQS